MTRLAARRLHLAALAATATAAIVAGWAWNEATRPVRWAGHLTEGWRP
jgi:hypothetical protein